MDKWIAWVIATTLLASRTLGRHVLYQFEGNDVSQSQNPPRPVSGLLRVTYISGSSLDLCGNQYLSLRIEISKGNSGSFFNALKTVEMKHILYYSENCFSDQENWKGSVLVRDFGMGWLANTSRPVANFSLGQNRFWVVNEDMFKKYGFSLSDQVIILSQGISVAQPLVPGSLLAVITALEFIWELVFLYRALSTPEEDPHLITLVLISASHLSLYAVSVRLTYPFQLLTGQLALFCLTQY